jgi:hypothetical protein
MVVEIGFDEQVLDLAPKDQIEGIACRHPFQLAVQPLLGDREQGRSRWVRWRSHDTASCNATTLSPGGLMMRSISAASRRNTSAFSSV